MDEYEIRQETPAAEAVEITPASFAAQIDKDIKYFAANPTSGDLLAIGPNNKSARLAGEEVINAIKNILPGVDPVVTPKAAGNVYTVKMNAAGGKSGKDWAQALIEARPQLNASLSVWVHPELDQKTRNYLNASFAFANHLKDSYPEAKRFNFTHMHGFLVVNGVVLGPPSLLPPPSKWPLVTGRVIAIIDSLSPYAEPEKPMSEQVPMDIVHLFMPHVPKPKFMKSSQKQQVFLIFIPELLFELSIVFLIFTITLFLCILIFVKSKCFLSSQAHYISSELSKF